MSEEWRRIQAVNGYYQISTEARVRNMIPVRKGHLPRYLSPYAKGDMMCIHLAGRNLSLARLLLITFRPIQNSRVFVVGFRDGNPLHVSLPNLEWRYRGASFSSLTVEDVKAIRVLWANSSDSYPKIAARFNVSAETIGLIIRGDAWKDVS